MDWSYRRNFLWVSSPGLHTLSREKFVSCSHKYQGRVEFRILFKLLHTKQLNTALKTATSSRSRSIFSSNSWWEMCSSGNRTRSVRLVENTVPFNIRKFRKFKPGFLVKWNAPPMCKFSHRLVETHTNSSNAFSWQGVCFLGNVHFYLLHSILLVHTCVLV